MTSREAIAKLNVLSSYDTEKEKREEYKECILAIIEDLDVLEKYKRVMCKPIVELMKDLEELDRYRNEKYKHWNIFFNGAKLEYLLYLEQKGKESFMTSISEDLYSRIKKHFLE